MIGQGRPSSLALALGLCALVLGASFVVTAPAQLSLPRISLSEAPQPAEATPSVEAPITPVDAPVRLQFRWGGGPSRQWVGRMRLTSGEFSDLALQSTAVDAAGSMWLDRGELVVRALSSHDRERVEVIAISPPDASISIELAVDVKSAPVRLNVPLADLGRRPYQARLDSEGNTIEVEVKPTSPLHIAVNRGPRGPGSRVYAMGDQMSFELMLELPASLHGTNLDVHTALTPIHRKGTVWTDSQKLAVPVDGRDIKVHVTVPLQQPEGAYTVHVAVSRPSGYFRDKFLNSAAAPIAERSFDVAIIEPRSAAPPATSHWTHVLEIDPTNPGWTNRLPNWAQLRRVPGLSLSRGAIGSIRASAVNLPLGRFIELPALADGGEPHWQGYVLPLQDVGVPHMIEIEFPADGEQDLGVAIVEPDTNGAVEGVHLDAGVFVEGFGRSQETQKQTHRVLFWPRTEAPMLVVSNRHPSAAAHFGAFRVLKRVGPLAEAPTRPSSTDNRLIAAYIARPCLTQNFAAASGYEAAARLSDYIRYSGYNSAIVALMANTDTPVADPARGPLNPNGSASAFDPLVGLSEFDIALPIFKRDGLTLIPAIEFAGPLPQLESLRRIGDATTSGIEPVGPDGRTWLETYGARGGRAPYYNVLEPRVQQAIVNTVQDVVRRFGDSSAFGGLAIQLTSDGYTQLPPAEWCLDDATIRRFESATGITLSSSGPDRFRVRHELLRSQYADAWRSWRTEEIARFYGRLADVVCGNTDRRMLLMTERLFDHPQIQQRLRPNLLLTQRRVGDTMLELGIDRQLLERVPGLIFCPTFHSAPLAPLADRAVELELNAEFAQGELSPKRSARASGTLYCSPRELHLPSFAGRAAGSFKVDSDVRFTGQPVPHVTMGRKLLVQMLAASDPGVLIEGGEFLSLSQDDILRSVRTAISHLPVNAEVTELANEPVIVRTYPEANRVTILVMNASPWPATANISLTLPQYATLVPLVANASVSDARNNPVALNAGNQPWVLALGPYDVHLVRIDVPDAKVTGVRADMDAAGKTELKSYLAELNNRDLTAKRVYRAPSNPGFEPIGSGISGWRVEGGASNTIVQLDATQPQEGKTSLYFRNGGPHASVVSDEFKIPATGQLAMTVFARGANIGPNTDLRLVLESRRHGHQYRRAASLAASQLQRANLDWGQPIAIVVNDLPYDSNGTMRIVFELTGSGEVWLDNVVLYDSLCALPFWADAKKETYQIFKLTHAAQSTFEAGKIIECLDLVDGYWPRHIMEYFPPIAPQVAVAVPAAPSSVAPSTGPPAAPTNPNEDSSEGFGERLKRMVPLLR